MSQPRVLRELDYLNSQSILHTQSIASIQEQLSMAVAQAELSTVSVGEEVYLYEGDVLVPFIVVHKGAVTVNNTATEQTILMRKYPLPPDYLGVGITSYAGSYLDTYLNNTYKDLLSVEYLSFDLPISSQNGIGSSINRSVFIPSYMELSGNTTTVAGRIVSEGFRFSYFASGNPIICTHNGVGVNYFLRTPYDLSSYYIVTSTGNYSFSASRDEQYIRPFISLYTSGNVYKKIFNDTSNTLAIALLTDGGEV